MRILVIGGGVFLGAALLDSALARGHAVTVFNRGRARSTWPDGVEVVAGDRMHDLARLAGRSFDAAIDTCGHVPADVRTSGKALDEVGRYCFVSSISAYASFAHAPVHEDGALASSAGLAADDRDRSHYGPQKAACERVVEAAFGARALIVRPGLIVGPAIRPAASAIGPGARSRAARCSSPTSRTTSRSSGSTCATSPTGPCVPSRTMRGRLQRDRPAARRSDGLAGAAETCTEAARRRGAPPAQIVRVGETFLRVQGVAPWNELPLWVPSTDRDHRGFARVDCRRAVAAVGLVTRPLAETVEAVLDELRSSTPTTRACAASSRAPAKPS